MTGKPIVSMDKAADCIRAANFGFVNRVAEATKYQLILEIVNPTDKGSSFKLTATCLERMISFAIPQIEHRPPTSTMLCTILNANYDYQLGRFAWTPDTGEIRFISELYFMGPDATAEDLIVRQLPKFIEDMLHMFYGGYLRMLIHSEFQGPAEEKRMLIDDALRVLYDKGILTTWPEWIASRRNKFEEVNSADRRR